MASLAQKLFRSFVNTLFYVWTVIQALFSLRSPNPFPFRETSIVVPYPLDIDLESGSGGMKRCRGTTPMSSPAPSPTLLTPSQKTVQKTISADAHRQDSLRCSPVFSSTPRLDGAHKVRQSPPDVSLSASAKAMLLASWATKSMTMSDHECSLPSTPLRVENEITEDTIGASRDVTLDPFLDANPASPFLFVNENNDHRLEDVLPISFKLAFCTSTPPRSRRDRKGHKRAALATITNIAHLNIPAALAESPPSPTATEPVDTPLKEGKGHKRAALATITNITHLNIPASFAESLPSPTATEPFVDTPTVRRLRSPSLSRTPEDIHSASPTRPSPTKYPPLPAVLGSSPGIQFSPVTPLRIVKRNGANPAGVQTPPKSEASVDTITPVQRNSPNLSSIRSLVMSDVSKIVASAVRNAFAEIRDEDPDDEGMAARELISRASVWTCDFSRYDSDMDSVQDGEESEEECGQEVTVGTSGSESPPPPYVFSNPNLSPTLARKTEGVMLQPACAVPAGASTELSCLERNTLLSSVDSCLDDLLASFEQLITTMPKFPASLARSQGPLLSTTVGTKKGVDTTSVLDTVRCALNDVHGGRANQWSDVLESDKY